MATKPKGRSKKRTIVPTWGHPPHSGIKVANVTNGVVYGISYRVIIPASVTGRAGKRDISRPKTESDAFRHAEDQLRSYKQLGSSFAMLPPEVQREAAVAWAKLEPHGIGFIRAAEQAILTLRPTGGERTVGQVIDELKEQKALRLSRVALRKSKLGGTGKRSTNDPKQFQ